MPPSHKTVSYYLAHFEYIFQPRKYQPLGYLGSQTLFRQEIIFQLIITSCTLKLLKICVHNCVCSITDFTFISRPLFTQIKEVLHESTTFIHKQVQFCIFFVLPIAGKEADGTFCFSFTVSSYNIRLESI